MTKAVYATIRVPKPNRCTVIREAFGLGGVGSSTSTSALICLGDAESNLEVKPTLDGGPGGPREAGFEQRRLVAPEGGGEAVGDLHGANPDGYRVEVLRRGGRAF